MKLCGKNEDCFEFGPQWGHWEGCICLHYYEKNVVDDNGNIINNCCVQMCERLNCEVKPYTTAYEYDKLINEINFLNFMMEFCGENISVIDQYKFILEQN